MCGICGTVSFKGFQGDRSIIAAMASTIIHRGPDDEGIYTAPHIGLGQRRLAIIDLSHAAAAPLTNEDGSIWVVFNGEVYNFETLRSELIAKGHTFRTSTDTEVLVHLYEEHGTACVHHLRGMFAFAIWDSRKKELFAARDRLGKKPFFYTTTSSAFIFGSEIKAITAHPDVSRAPNFAAIDAYLTYQYVPNPLTAFAQIHKLPPGHYLCCKTDGSVKIQQYWSPPLSLEKTSASTEEIEQQIVSKLDESVRIRMVSDVPLGAFLSGGIDSATVVALMSLASSRPVKTFSIGFEEDEFNELPYARMIARKYATDHHEYVVKPNAAEILPLLVKHYNEPFADFSALPTFYVSKLARNHVTVALSGDGGDESFAGYGHYRQMMQWSKADALPLSVRQPLANWLIKLSGRLPYSNGKSNATKALRMLGANVPDRYFLQLALFKSEEKEACYTPLLKSLIADDAARMLTQMEWDESTDSLDWMMRHDQAFLLPNDFLVKTDVASMANSLELRSPFLDHELIECAARIPSNLKRQGAQGKIILKRAVAHLLPQEVLHKPKTGFGMPLGKWFRGELGDVLKSHLLDQRAIKRGLFEPSFIKQILSDHMTGRRDWTHRLWALLFLEMWFREFLDP
jgi:asparagine synthase (glutamine-hydrolysing)